MDFSLIITDRIPDLNIMGAGVTAQCFPLYSYESSSYAEQKRKTKIFAASQTALSGMPELATDEEEKEETYIRKDGITDFILKKAQTRYADSSITKEDIFYYVYGFLNSPDYKTTFANDLKKMLPRIPLVKSREDFEAFSQAGRKLAELQIHYETAEPYTGVNITGTEKENYKVTKMRFVNKGDKSRIRYNDAIIISDIPELAYGYTIRNRSAIEWVMERYAVTTDKDSGIKNDPNVFAEETGNPRYILDLLLRIITVSMRTMDIVDQLPKVTFTEEEKV